MRAYVISSGVRIAPFGDLVRDLPVGGVRLSTWQGDLFRKFGLTMVPVEKAEEVPANEPRLVTYDNVFFTRRILKSFLRLHRGKPSRVALPLDSTLIKSF